RTRRQPHQQFLAEFEPVAASAQALAAKAAALVVRAQSMDLDRSVVALAMPLLTFLSGWIIERSRDIEAARATLTGLIDGAPAVAAVPTPVAAKPIGPRALLAHERARITN